MEFVRLTNKPSWEIGEVIQDQQASKVSVFFPDLNEVKRLNLDVAKLELIEEAVSASTAPDSLDPLPRVDLEKVRALCEQFIVEMKDNRRGVNDAGVAEVILQDLAERNTLRRSTIKRLSAWCHTNGSVFQSGASIAQETSMALFGRIIRLD
jgi:hypothetical protein